jgi:hypothetical protein
VLSSGADVLGLGCTHYPIIRPQIRRALGRGVRIYDSARPVARRIRAVLAERDALSPARRGGVALFSTRDADRLTDTARRLLPPPQAAAQGVSLEDRGEVREVRLEGTGEAVVGTLRDPGAGPCCYTTDRADSRGRAGHDAGAGRSSDVERCAR